MTVNEQQLPTQQQSQSFYSPDGLWFWNSQQWVPAPIPAQVPTVVINQAMVPSYIVARSGTNHAFHLVMTILTAGLWLPIWLIVAVANSR